MTYVKTYLSTLKTHVKTANVTSEPCHVISSRLPSEVFAKKPAAKCLYCPEMHLSLNLGTPYKTVTFSYNFMFDRKFCLCFSKN